MSLILTREPYFAKGKKASDLDSGTWFTDQFGQIFLIALDDRFNERRLVSVGDFCQPFIPNIGLSNVDVDRILLPGSMMQITASILNEEGR